MQPKTFCASIFGAEQAGKLCQQLVSLSVWFAVEPCPYDEYVIVVKAENTTRLQAAIAEAQESPCK